MKLSKSKFVAGVQCLKRLYLLVHEPELAAEAGDAAQAIMEQGREVGLLARRMFPGGVAVENCETLDEALRKTKELVANPDIPAIFEAAFSQADVVVRVDMLQRRRDGRWRLVEVKSTTSLKDQHLEDVAIQYRVLSRCGLDVVAACLAHVNRDYVFEGGDIDPRRFFRIRNLTGRIKRLQAKLTFQIRTELRVLELPNAPDVTPGRQCSEPIECEFYAQCNPSLPDDHVLRLPRLHASAAEELADLGIVSMRDIREDFELSETQRHACDAVRTGEPWFGAELSSELAKLEYPLFFMDFETINPAIPRFSGMRPYDQLPFQWSVHVQRKPGAAPEHFGFLATDNGDPRCAFIESLIPVLGDRGNIVVYNAGFECQRLTELAEYLPEYAKQIEAIQSRVWDLLPLVRNHVYHSAFAGSYSLKSVLPALVPQMTYAGMQIADGRAAGIAWDLLVNGNLSEGERESTRTSLLRYCGLDTFAMLRLLEVLRSAVCRK